MGMAATVEDFVIVAEDIVELAASQSGRRPSGPQTQSVQIC